MKPTFDPVQRKALFSVPRPSTDEANCSAMKPYVCGSEQWSYLVQILSGPGLWLRDVHKQMLRAEFMCGNFVDYRLNINTLQFRGASEY